MKKEKRTEMSKGGYCVVCERITEDIRCVACGEMYCKECGTDYEFCPVCVKLIIAGSRGVK